MPGWDVDHLVGCWPPCRLPVPVSSCPLCCVSPPTRRPGRGSLQAAGPFLPLLLLLTPRSAHPHPPGWTPPRGTCRVGCVHGGRSSPLPPSEEGLRGNGNEECVSPREIQAVTGDWARLRVTADTRRTSVGARGGQANFASRMPSPLSRVLSQPLPSTHPSLMTQAPRGL